MDGLAHSTAHTAHETKAHGGERERKDKKERSEGKNGRTGGGFYSFEPQRDGEVGTKEGRREREREHQNPR